MIDVYAHRLYWKGFWPCFHAEYRKLQKRYKLAPRPWAENRREGMDRKATEYQQHVFDRSGKLPSVCDVADHAGPLANTLSLPEFSAARRVIEAVGGKNARGRRDQAARRKREAKAIDFLDKCLNNGLGIPTMKEIAEAVGSKPRTPGKWEDLLMRRRLVAKARGISLRSRPSGKEQAAIDFLAERLEAGGSFPSRPEIADVAGVALSTQYHWKRFDREYRRRQAVSKADAVGHSALCEGR